MPKKKTWTPERRKAASDAAKARLEQKSQLEKTTAVGVSGIYYNADGTKVLYRGEQQQPSETERQSLNEQIAKAPQPSTDPDLSTLIQQIKEANDNIAKLQSQLQNQPEAPQNQAASAAGGVLTGTYERFTTDSKYYPDPTARLAREPRLSRFAFEDNYELKWEVQLSQYETIDRIRTKEPRFNLKLIVKVYDDLTGELTNRRFVILQGIFHEDPDAALAIAHDNGIEVEAQTEKEFLDEMRYLRFRDWLLEAFFPTSPPPSNNKKEIVIGNKLVEVYEVTSYKQESMAAGFASMTKKL